MQYLLGLALFGLISIVPLALTVLVIVDVVRTGANRYWIMIVLLFPVAGPIAYLLLERSPWFGDGSRTLSPSVAKKRGARRRLQELQVQLGHWRGPALLVEAGEALLILGKSQQAEAHLREARQSGAEPEKVNLPLALALQAQGKNAEAVPLLEELHQNAPDFKRGEADLCLARCLDESGRSAEAETVLRRVLERHHFAEAQVRLARICLASQRQQEARQLLDTVIADVSSLPRKLMRPHRPWLRAAVRLKRGRTNLPRVGDPTADRKRQLLIGAGIAAVVLLVVAGGLVAVSFYLKAWYQSIAESMPAGPASRPLPQLADLDDRFPWPYGDNLEAVDLTPDAIAAYVELRQALQPPLTAYHEAKQTYETQSNQVLREAIADNTRAMPLIGTTQQAHRQWSRAKEELISSLRRNLEQQQMGPEAFARHISIIEWRFLGRQEALLFGLSSYERNQWIGASSILGLHDLGGEMGVGSPAGKLAEMQRRQAEEQVATLTRAAEGNRNLSPATRRLLEEQRASLECLDTTGLAHLVGLIDMRLLGP